MSHRIPKLLALTGVSAALALGGAGIAQASPDHGTRKDEHCKSLHGKKKRKCEQRHHHGRHH